MICGVEEHIKVGSGKLTVGNHCVHLPWHAKKRKRKKKKKDKKEMITIDSQ